MALSFYHQHTLDGWDWSAPLWDATLFPLRARAGRLLPETGSSGSACFVGVAAIYGGEYACSEGFLAQDTTVSIQLWSPPEWYATPETSYNRIFVAEMFLDNLFLLRCSIPCEQSLFPLGRSKLCSQGTPFQQAQMKDLTTLQCDRHSTCGRKVFSQIFIKNQSPTVIYSAKRSARAESTNRQREWKAAFRENAAPRNEVQSRRPIVSQSF